MPHALAFEAFGPPAEVLSWRETSSGPLGAGQVRVRIEASPINPADLNRIEGTYGTRPPLPAVGGVEGAARVVETGSDVESVKPGDLVRLRGGGYWREEAVVPAEEVVPFPPGLTAEQAALFQVNPATAWGLLHEFARLQPGDWVVQNAATSDVGAHVIALARHYGWRTLNLVRREGDVAPLKAAGADAVTAAADAESLLRETGGARPVLALNAVGGESAALLAKVLAPDAAHVTYGAMGRQPVKLSNRALIFENIAFHGFWVSRWRTKADPVRVAAMEGELAGLFAGGVLRARVEARYAFPQYREALAHAAREGKKGKVLFVPGQK
ncbi:MAG: 2-enoyl thioester reductase domain-containing protein [Verrucomicrobium sp.]|nr:2-enoyl thioester reductase domain-containing protein [Verrucomicrobium sp.]